MRLTGVGSICLYSLLFAYNSNANSKANGSNPTVYWIDVSDKASYYIEKREIKVAKYGGNVGMFDSIMFDNSKVS